MLIYLQEHVFNFFLSPIQRTTFLAMFEIDSSSPEGEIIIIPRQQGMRETGSGSDSVYRQTCHSLIEKDHLGDWSPEKDCC